MVLSGEDFVREFGPNGLLTVDSCVAADHYKEGRMFDSWQIRWHHVFDLQFVVSDQEMSYCLLYKSKFTLAIRGFTTGADV